MATSTLPARYREMSKSDIAAMLVRRGAQLRAAKERIERSRMPAALAGGAASVAGGTLAGGLRGWRDEIAGVPTDAGLGIAASVAGVALGIPLLVHGGAGALSAYAATVAEAAVAARLSAD